MMIVNLEYLTHNVVNDELYELCTSDPAKVERYMRIVENKVKLFLDIEQFKQDDEYLFPEDLKDAVRFLIESLYLNKSLNLACGKVQSYSEKFDDYSDSMSFDTSGTAVWYGIPILADYLAILKKYQTTASYRPSGRIGI